jgi:IS30 family transposase
MPAVRVMLMLSDREEISRGLAEGLEYKEIGLRLGRDSSIAVYVSADVCRGSIRYRPGARVVSEPVGRAITSGARVPVPACKPTTPH